MRNFILAATILIGGATAVLAQSLSPNGVKTLAPEGAIKTTGTWDVGTRAGDFVFVAGMRGIDPKTNTLVQGEEARIRQAFLNMKLIAESAGVRVRCGHGLGQCSRRWYRSQEVLTLAQEAALKWRPLSSVAIVYQRWAFQA